MWQKHHKRSCFRESLKALEADIQHANSLAASLPRDFAGRYVQMRLSYSPFASLVLFLFEWMDYTCTATVPTYLGLLHIIVYKVNQDGMPTVPSKERKASLREFYAVIYPSLRQLEDQCSASDESDERSQINVVYGQKTVDDRHKSFDRESDRDEECGICMESCTKMILPNCGHSMCISCFHDWYVRSQSCPFCRGSLQRVNPNDLWVLIREKDVLDISTLKKENLTQFYLYTDNLPPAMPEMHYFLHDYMM